MFLRLQRLHYVIIDRLLLCKSWKRWLVRRKWLQSSPLSLFQQENLSCRRPYVDLGTSIFWFGKKSRWRWSPCQKPERTVQNMSHHDVTWRLTEGWQFLTPNSQSEYFWILVGWRCSIMIGGIFRCNVTGILFARTYSLMLSCATCTTNFSNN